MTTTDNIHLQESTIKQLLELNKDPITGKPLIRIGAEPVHLLTQMANIFVQEAIDRSLQQAIEHNTKHVDNDHLLKILPQLLIDFA
jgi:hypothetical protein